MGAHVTMYIDLFQCRPVTGIALLKLAAIREPTVYKMWEPRRLKTLSAFTASYRDCFNSSRCHL
jgi:hypothetical protein